VEHAGWVAFENVFLVIACLRSVRKMRFIASRTAKLEASEEAARSANRAKDRFLGVLSHELRSPLTPVLAVVSYLVKQTSKLPSELRNEIEMIRRNIELETRLIDDLLDITRISNGKLELTLEVTDAHLAVRDAGDICAQDIRTKNLAVVWDLAASDPVRLQQIYWNILTNAVKFTPADGSILLRSRNDAQGNFVLEIEDTGIGIEPEARDHIFDAFEQGERSITREFGGLGLGLAISKSLVHSHGGGLVASSAGKNAGATFTITFKAVAPERIAPTAHPISPKQERALRILVVDDHADTRRVLANLLRARGHEIFTAVNVATGLEVLSRESVDVLLSDIGLPDGTGYGLMERAKALQPLTGIAISGFGTAEDVARAIEAGFAHHLVKPVNFNQVEVALARVMPKRAFGGDPVVETPDALQQAS